MQLGTASDSLVEIFEPREILSKLELAIIRAAKEIFPEKRINTCFYHLLQSMYRKIHKLGLQDAYVDPENTEVKDFVYLTGALTLVPVGDVRRNSRHLKAAAPANISGKNKTELQ